MILDGGPCAIGLESTILSLVEAIPRILRPGGTSLEELALMLQTLDASDEVLKRPQAPGQMERHYATLTPLDIIAENQEDVKPTEKVGLLCFGPPEFPPNFEVVETLSNSGNICEAAANLFRSLRRLDQLNLDRIIARPVPEEGLGIAIMDRLRRCSMRTASSKH